ncbi:MAG: MFS transporter [Chloroflexi bacterium]|nr:MFS transporter [Chloroflexota bacterium]
MDIPGTRNKSAALRTGAGKLPFALRTFRSLRVRQFRFFIASSLAQTACMNMQQVTTGWFAYKLTGSTALLGVTMLASAIPQLALSVLGGTLADRISKKLILSVGLIASALVALWIGLSTSLHIITWHYLVVSSFLQGSVMALMMPSRQSLISELVGRDNLMNAVALNSSVMNVNQIGAPAIAGFMIAGAGIEGVYYLMVALYLVAAAFIYPLRLSPGGASSGNGRNAILRDIKDGISYVRQNETVLVLLLLTFLTVLFSMPFRALLPVFTEDILKVGPEKLGILMSASGIGALAGSLVIASLGEKGRGMLFLHGGILTGLAILAFSFSSSYTLSLVIMVVTGLGQAGRMALGNTLLQTYTEDAYLGRVMSLFMMQWGLVGLGTFGVSIAAEFVGVQLAVGATALLLVLSTLYFYLFSPRVRRLE